MTWPFTDHPPAPAVHSRRRYRAWSDALSMADFLVVLGVIGFVAAMLGLIWGLERV
ncbi:hypothetical protein [Micromonospora sp. NPDC005173]|uniref:hypothetical protein n=1 Tax=Micromonospora sp. NPDC005173 TaxID=3157165 RepID=UPI0033B991B7